VELKLKSQLLIAAEIKITVLGAGEAVRRRCYMNCW